jgi:hypothetical protein
LLSFIPCFSISLKWGPVQQHKWKSLE